MKYLVNVNIGIAIALYLYGSCVFAQSIDTEPQVYVGGIIQDKEPRAVVNGVIVRAGDTISGVTVTRIEDSGVTFTYQGKIFRRRVGEGRTQQSSWGLGVASGDTQITTDRAELFRSKTGELTKMAQESYAQAQAAYGRSEEESALVHYDAANRNAQGAYAYANETQRVSLRQFMNTCAERIRQIRGEPATVGDVASYNLTSPEAIASWMAAHIAYKKDEMIQEKRDYWQSPEETLILESGDCEDLAFLAQAFLQEIEIPSLVVTIEDREKKTAHALCVFSRTPPYNCIDGTILVMVNKETIKELVQELYPNSYIANKYVAYTTRSIPLFDDKGDVIIPQ